MNHAPDADTTVTVAEPDRLPELHEIAESLAGLADVADALIDMAGGFTCDEAEVLTYWLRLAGAAGKAEVFLTCHGAYGDTDVDDRHRTPAAVLAALDRLQVRPAERGEDRVVLVHRIFASRT